mgnify:CR=1 FL=1
MTMVFWLKLVELLHQLNLTSNPLCLMFKHPTATNLWEQRSASRELGISSTILAEVSKLLVLNYKKCGTPPLLIWERLIS